MALFDEQGSAAHDDATVILLWLEDEGPFSLTVGFDSPRRPQYGFVFRRRVLLRVADVDILATE